MAGEAVVFSLTSVIDAIEAADENVQYFANVKTGQIEPYFDRIAFGDVGELDEDDFEGEEWVGLPDKWDRDDWEMLRDFAYELGGAEGDELLHAIHGKGAFRMFRAAVERMGALESWYAYKDERYRRLAVEWLEENGLAWTDDRHENLKRDWRALLPKRLRTHLRLTVLESRLSVGKFASVPTQLPAGDLVFVASTPEEVSVVCETEAVPDGAIACEAGWRAFKVQGPLDFALVGVLAQISSALSNADIPLFAVSTFDTDYVLVKQENLDAAVGALKDCGCEVDTSESVR